MRRLNQNKHSQPAHHKSFASSFGPDQAKGLPWQSTHRRRGAPQCAPSFPCARCNSSQFESDKRISQYHSFGEVEWPQAGAPSYGLKRRHKGWAGSSCSPKILRYGTTAMFPLLPLVLSASSCATATPTQNKNCKVGGCAPVASMQHKHRSKAKRCAQPAHLFLHSVVTSVRAVISLMARDVRGGGCRG